jgi:hypothetical protein
MRPEHVPFTVVIPLGSPSADALDGLPGAYFHAHRKCRIEEVSIVNGANIAASDTDFVLLNLKNGSNVVALLDTRAAGNGALAARTGKTLTLNPANAVIAENSTLVVAYDETDAGTNVALTSAVLQVTGYWIETQD